MKKWLLLISFIEASTVLTTVYFEPTYCVRGKLWGEAFFEGRSTSYWRAELERWEVRKEFGYNWMGCKETVYQRNPTDFERFRERWLPAKVESDWDVAVRMRTRHHGPRLLWGEDAAQAMLKDLRDDPSPKIRLFAQIGLGMNPKIPGDDD